MVDIHSRLAVDREQLWAVVSTMDGVNAELSPWLRMSIPIEVRGKSLADVRIGEDRPARPGRHRHARLRARFGLIRQ